MTDLLKKPWIVESLKAAFESRHQDLTPTTDGRGELSFSNPKKRVVQLLKVKALEPTATASLSDGDVSITAEFTESCIADLLKAHPGKPFSGYGNAIFHLISYQIIFSGSSAELFEKAETFAQQAKERFAPGDNGRNGSRTPASARSHLRMVVRSMRSLGADGNPVVGKPKSANNNETICRLLQLVPVKESRLPPKIESKPVTRTNKNNGTGGRKTSESPINRSSQPFATQIRPGLYQDSDEEDDDASVISQQGGSVKPEKPKSKKRAAQDYSDLDFPGAQGVPPSSPPVRSIRTSSQSSKANYSRLHPGWGEMTEVTWEMARIPKGQRKKLENSGCWWPPTGSQYVSGYDQLPKVQLVPKSHPPRVRTVVEGQYLPKPQQPIEPPNPTAPAQSKKPSDQQYDSDSTECFSWSPSSQIEHQRPLRDLNMPPPSSFSMASSPLRAEKSPVSSLRASQPPIRPDNSEGGGETGTKIDDETKVVDSLVADDESDAEEETAEKAEEGEELVAAEVEESKPDSDLEVSTQVRKEMLEPEVEDKPPVADAAAETEDAQSIAEVPESANELDTEDGPKIADQVSEARKTSRESSASVSRQESRGSKRAATSEASSTSTSAKRITRAANGISKSIRTSAPPERKRPRKMAESRGPSRKTARKSARQSYSPQNEEDSEPDLPKRRSPSLEPPFRVINPHGITPVDKYGTLRAQEVAMWKAKERKKRDREKLKIRLEGEYEFFSEEEDGDGDDDDGDGSNAEATDIDTEDPDPQLLKIASQPVVLIPARSSRETTAVASAVHDDDDDFPSAPAVPFGGKENMSQGNALADNDDDDFPSAPAVPLGGKKSMSPGNALKESVKAMNLPPPPSTAPNFGPIIQVKETPARRANSTSNSPINVRIQFNKAYDADGEDRVPSTHQQITSSMETGDEVPVDDQPTSSMEYKDEVPDRQPTSFINLSLESMESTTTKESDKSLGPKVKMEAEHDEVEYHSIQMPQTPPKEAAAASPPPPKQNPPKRKVFGKLRYADFASQEIREASRDIDMSKLLEEQYRRFHNQPPSKRSHPLSSSSSPPAKRQKTSSPPLSTMSRRLSAILLGDAPPPSPPSPSPSSMKRRPALPTRRDTGSEPDAIQPYEPRPPAEKGAQEPYTPTKKPIKRPKQQQQDRKAPCSGPTANPNAGSAANVEPSQKVVARAKEVPAPGKAAKEVVQPAAVPSRKAEKRKAKEPELYAGFPPRILTFPNDEQISPEDRAELDRRRQAFYGTHDVEPWICTPGTDTTPFPPPPPRPTQKKKGASEEDMWWLDDAAPMRRFVGKFMQLKAVKEELRQPPQ